MHRRASILLAAGLLFGCANPPAQQEDNLIGGERIEREAYGATVRLLQSRCTGALVTPQHILTAAHCVFNASRGIAFDEYASGALLELETSRGTLSAEIADVSISPTWADACTNNYCGIAQIAAQQDAADVAVIELAAPLEGIEPAPMTAEQLAVGDDVILVGFGCEDGLYEEDDRDDVSLATASSRVVPTSDALHEGSYLLDPEMTAGSYVFTAGPAHPDGGPGLCPGDSGGPIYVERDGVLHVAGVNANYSLRPEAEDPHGLPVTNWHTRIDDRSRHGIAAWLSDVTGSAQKP